MSEQLFQMPLLARRDPVNAQKVPCPHCGALAGRPCKAGDDGAPPPPRGIFHLRRTIWARIDAGVADEPTPQLELE